MHSPAHFPSVWTWWPFSMATSSLPSPNLGWPGSQQSLGPQTLPQTLFSPQAVTPCQSVSAALHPGTGSDTTGFSALTMAGCTSHHASPSPHSRPWWIITLVWPFLLSIRPACGVLGAESCAFAHFACWRISRQAEEGPSHLHASSCAKNLGWGLYFHPMP